MMYQSMETDSLIIAGNLTLKSEKMVYLKDMMIRMMMMMMMMMTMMVKKPV